jgi:pseudoazurin
MKTVWAASVAFALAGTAALAGAAGAAEYEVQMLNRGADGQVMAFEPAYLEVAPGDTVRFVATNPGHNTETIAGMVPEGAEGWKGEFNDEVTVTLTEEGIYGYRCMPHYGMGMVGVVVVGDGSGNAEAAAAVSHPGRAGQRMAELLQQSSVEQTADAASQ